ncbi:MAG: hypothetical protein JRL30_02670 [Deltaproteobacteria bacterium]|nr:hypothetical protein [Deltaproteobacteria bacterium]
MNHKSNQKAKVDSSDLIQCAMCRHFSYFDNDDGHNSPSALGRCAADSWDGNRGQWAMFQHHCKQFVKTAPD